MPKINLQTPTSRARLSARGKPYEARLLRGVTLGYRRPKTGGGAWVVIAANGKGGRWTSAFAQADDAVSADGSAVLNYEQAALKARALARGDANAASTRPATIDEAISAYEADLTGRDRNGYNARLVRVHRPAHLAAQPLSTITTKQLRAWRDALIEGGMLPATVNRVLKSAKAAFSLAGTLDPRVAANKDTWRTGLQEIPGTVRARDAVLTDAEVARAVAVGYGISDAFGLYVQTHAETGARTSQILRTTCNDLQRDRLMIPHSRKGRGGGKGGHIAVPLTPSLAARLLHAAAGRAADAPLLLRPDEKAWKEHSRAFTKLAKAAGLPAATTIYSLRHSSIVRMLLRNVPIKIVADQHDTSVAMIERHYGRWIKHHADDIVRAALIDTAPPAEPDKVVPLRRS